MRSGSLRLVALASALLFVACESRTRYLVLSRLVDGMPSYEEWLESSPPKPLRRYAPRKTREALAPAPVMPTPEPARNEIEQAKAKDEAFAMLPKDDSGAVDWVAALREGVISPRTAIEGGGEPLEQMPIDVEIGAEDPATSAIFPHPAHTQIILCDSCHPEPFQMAAGSTEMSMDAMYEGRLCGQCHGTVAFGLESCGRCHPNMR